MTVIRPLIIDTFVNVNSTAILMHVCGQTIAKLAELSSNVTLAIVPHKHNQA